MSSTLDRLRAAAAPANATVAPAVAAAPAPAAVVTPAPAVVVTPTPPPVVLATPATGPEELTIPATRIVEASVVPSAVTVIPAGELPKTSELTTTDAAQRAMAAMFGGSTGTTLAQIADSMDEGGVRESYPFATVRKGNWEAFKKVAQNIYDALPVGNRAYRMVYIAHRIAAQAWVGSGGPGGNKSPPIWSAAVQLPSVSQIAGELNMRVMRIGSKVQYTGGDARAKFDGVGRLAPEIHVFGWRPDTGFIVLICSTFKATELSIKAFAQLEGKGGVPIMLELDTEHQHNPRATDPAKRDWDVAFLRPSVVIDKPAQDLALAWDAVKAQDVVAVATECVKFARAEDYTGLNQQELIAKLDQYNALI